MKSHTSNHEDNKNHQYRIAIVGAGFAGLSLANYLEYSKSMSTASTKTDISYEIFESKPCPIPIIGTIQLPCAKSYLQNLSLLKAAVDAGVFPNQYDHNFFDVSREAFLNILRQNVEIRSNCRIVDVIRKQRSEDRNAGDKLTDTKLKCQHPPYFSFVVNEAGDEFGPYDLVVAADGLFGEFSLKANGSITARIGDSLRYSERWIWWDFGATRIQTGADTAIRDGLELGKRLLHLYSNNTAIKGDTNLLLKEFAMPYPDIASWRKQRKIALIMMIIPVLVAILYRAIQTFDRI